MAAMVVGCGCWWLVAGADAGASGVAFPRWSVGTISKDRHDQRGGTIDEQNGAHGAPYVGAGVGCRGQRGSVEQGRGVGQTGTARQRRLPGRVGRWRQAGRSGLSFAATGHGGQTGQTGAEEQHGGGFRDRSCGSRITVCIRSSGISFIFDNR